MSPLRGWGDRSFARPSPRPGAGALSRTLVPTCAAAWLTPAREAAGEDHRRRRSGWVGRAFDRWQRLVEAWIREYGRLLDRVLDHRWLTVIVAYAVLAAVLLFLTPPIRREFFPQADAGAFEMYVRAPSGTRLRVANERIAEVEGFIKRQIPLKDLRILVSEIGVTPDWSAAYTPNAGKMDTVIRVQLTEKREKGSYEYADQLRRAFAAERRFHDLEFAFNAGGLIRGALNEGKTTPINVRVTGNDHRTSHRIADRIRRRVANIDGVVDCRILQRLDYPEYLIDVDRTKAADLGLTQEEVMKSVIGALNSSIQYNKLNFWIDDVSGNPYFVGVQYPESSVESLQTLLDIPITGINQNKNDRRVAVERAPQLVPGLERDEDHGNPAPVMLSSLVKPRRGTMPTEITHVDHNPSIDLSIGVSGRVLGHVAEDVYAAIDAHFGRLRRRESARGGDVVTRWVAYDPDSGDLRLIEGAQIELSGEYARMMQTFRNLGIGLTLAVTLIYFMMVALDKSFLVPLCVLVAVPLILIGIWPALYLTGTSLNVQSLIGIIFNVGIKVASTVLMTDVAQELRKNEGLSPVQPIRKAAEMRVRPITMTALAAFFAMIPTALALDRGSEANAPLGRAILGGLIAGEPATLFVVPALYALMIRGNPSEPRDPEEAERQLAEGDGSDQ